MFKSFGIALVLILMIAFIHTKTIAQEPLATRVAAPVITTTENGSDSDDRYFIGVGDVLTIHVFDYPQLSREAMRVDSFGMIRMPMIAGEIQTTCRTESELAKEIARLYLKYQNDPQVDVFIKEYNSKPISVMGAVNKPGQFQLQRRLRLLELISFAGGTTERAGEHVLVTRSSDFSECNSNSTGPPATLLTFDLAEVIKGGEKSNPYLQSGDIVTVQEADHVYVVGNVFKPTTISLKEPISVTRAIAMAGGALPDSKTDRVRIIRQVPGSPTKTEIYVDLKAIDKHNSDDVGLQANDIVDVPVSSGKRALRTLLGAIAPAAAQFPLRIIP